MEKSFLMSSTLLEHLLFSLVENGNLGFPFVIHSELPPSPLPIPNCSAFCLICVGQVSQNIKFFALVLRKRLHAWGAPKYCIFSLSLALASFPSNTHVYQCRWQWCRELNANSKIPLWAQHCTNVADWNWDTAGLRGSLWVRRKRHGTLQAGSGPKEFSGGGGTHSNICRVRMAV